jgi:hypothetical protein
MVRAQEAPNITTHQGSGAVRRWSAGLVVAATALLVGGPLAAVDGDPVPRVEGYWFDITFANVQVEQFGDPGYELPDVDPSADGFAGSAWDFTPVCEVGACDVVVGASQYSCTLVFDGAGWSGQLARGELADGCEYRVDGGTPDDLPRIGEQPIAFVATEWVEGSDGPVATRLEGTWTFVSGNKGWISGSDGAWMEWVHHTTYTVDFVAVRDVAPTAPTPVTSATPVQAATPTTVGVTPVAGEAPGMPGAGDGGRSALAESRMSAAVRTPGEVSTDPVVVAVSAVLAILVVVAMPFPGELFNRTYDENYERITAWWSERLPGPVVAVFEARDGSARSAAGPLVAVTVLGGLLAGFLDPTFGFTLQSLAVFVAGMAAVAVVMTVALGVERMAIRQAVPELGVAARALPAGVLVAAACVVVSRVLAFEPGYLYGVLAGVALVGALSTIEGGRAAAAAAAGLGVVGLVSWLAWAGLGPIGEEPGFWEVVVDTFLAAVFVAAIEGMAFGLVPMRFLPGSKVLAWNRWVWAVLFGVGVFAVVHLIAHPGQGYGPTDSSAPLATAVALFAGFGTLSVSFWAWFRYREPSVGADART